MKIVKIVSDRPLTDFAPTWDISIGVTVWEEQEKIDAIRNWLIDNEQYIKDTFAPRHDGGTGLGKDSVTSRFGQYNLFDFSDKMPYLKDLLEFIQKSYIEFVTTESKKIEDLQIISWFNVLRSGQEIKEHNHSDSGDSYISGNVHLDNYQTGTYYRSPVTSYRASPIRNQKGGCIFFPSYVPHRTDTFESQHDVRVSIGFDLRLSNYVNASATPRPFMDNNVLKKLNS